MEQFVHIKLQINGSSCNPEHTSSQSLTLLKAAVSRKCQIPVEVVSTIQSLQVVVLAKLARVQ